MSGGSVAGSREVAAHPLLPELTWQAVVGAFVVSSLVALSYPYIVLGLGFGLILPGLLTVLLAIGGVPGWVVEAFPGNL